MYIIIKNSFWVGEVFFNGEINDEYSPKVPKSMKIFPSDVTFFSAQIIFSILKMIHPWNSISLFQAESPSVDETVRELNTRLQEENRNLHQVNKNSDLIEIIKLEIFNSPEIIKLEIFNSHKI